MALLCLVCLVAGLRLIYCIVAEFGTFELAAENFLDSASPWLAARYVFLWPLEAENTEAVVLAVETAAFHHAEALGPK